MTAVDLANPGIDGMPTGSPGSTAADSISPRTDRHGTMYGETASQVAARTRRIRPARPTNAMGA